MNVYPAMDLLGGRVVRLHQGRYDAVTVYAEDPMRVLADFAAEGATRVHIVDLDGARDGAATQAATIARLVRACAVPVQVGGGIRTREQIERYLDAGAERVVIGTAAVTDPALTEHACAAFPIVVAVDARDGRVATHGWQTESDVSAVDLAVRVVHFGARAVLYTDIARDGTGSGPNVDATAALARAVPGTEVIASGGIGSIDHVRALAARAEIAACVVGRALYVRSFTLAEAVAAARASG